MCQSVENWLGLLSFAGNAEIANLSYLFLLLIDSYQVSPCAAMRIKDKRPKNFLVLVGFCGTLWVEMGAKGL